MRAKLASVTALSIASLALFGAPSAAAQDATSNAQISIALDQFDPAPAGDAFFGLPSPFARGRVQPRGYVMVDFADQPLRLTAEGANGQGTTTKAVVGSQVFLHVGASLALFDRAMVSASLPIALAQGGDSLSVGGEKVAAPSSAALGDLRLGARVRLVGEDDGPAQLGVGAYVYVPTAPAGSFEEGSSTPTPSYTGEGSARVAPHLVFGGRTRLGSDFALAYTSLVGFSIKSSRNPTSVIYGAGVAALLLGETLQIGPEFYASTPIEPHTFTLSTESKIAIGDATNAELLIGARWRFWQGLTVGVAGGPGLSAAIGTPAFRLTGMIGWLPAAAASSAAEEKTEDADKDGVLGAADACPYAAGPSDKDAKQNGCPVLDDDDDGVPNDQDKCPNDYAKATDATDRKGCPPPPPPPDTDGDGIADEKDACPKEAGPVSQDAAKNGCAPPANPDVDADGILDAEDACPQEKGVKSSDPKANGCKTLVRINDRKLAIAQPIELKKGKADEQVVDVASEPVLAQIKETLSEHPEIVKLEIGAYTDDDGKESYNIKLSQARADAVRKWLIDHGVSEGRLVSKGYGPKDPIASNKTKEGRARNKRVELMILEKK